MNKPYKTIRRDWIKRQIEKGNIEAKCDYIYTDDYAYDNAVEFQKTDWMPARLAPERRYEKITLQNGNEVSHLTNSDEQSKDGYITFDNDDFDYSTGRAYWDENGETISFIPLSNHSYTLRIKNDQAKPEPKPEPKNKTPKTPAKKTFTQVSTGKWDAYKVTFIGTK